MTTQDFFDNSIRSRVCVIGDLVLDEYIFGDVSRISPEAPVPVLRHKRRSRTVGGAGNVAANIASLGGEPELVSISGDDVQRSQLLELFESYDVPHTGIVKSANRNTTLKIRFLAPSQQVLRYDIEDTDPLDETEFQNVFGKAEQAISRSDCVVLSDYGKGLFDGDLTERVIELSRQKGVPVIVDPKGSDYRKYSGATVITPNRKELREATGMSVDSDEQVVLAARKLIADLNVDYILATRSEQGMSVVTSTEEHHIRTVAQEVFDVSGAGDTVVAALAIALSKGITSFEAAVIANAAGGLSVSRQGTTRISAAEVQSVLINDTRLKVNAPKFLDWEKAQCIVGDWRAHNLKVGFTNGCFDVLHAGHTTALYAAKAQCDRLVLGLNSDASVARLKGPTRPVNSAEDRAAVLAALQAVDVIVLFEEDTPFELIRHLEPDMLFKGADYTVETVVGADIVLERGGKVVLLELLEGRSTTSTIEKLAENNETQDGPT